MDELKKKVLEALELKNQMVTIDRGDSKIEIYQEEMEDILTEIERAEKLLKFVQDVDKAGEENSTQLFSDKTIVKKIISLLQNIDHV